MLATVHMVSVSPPPSPDSLYRFCFISSSPSLPVKPSTLCGDINRGLSLFGITTSLVSSFIYHDNQLVLNTKINLSFTSATTLRGWSWINKPLIPALGTGYFRNTPVLGRHPTQRPASSILHQTAYMSVSTKIADHPTWQNKIWYFL